MLCDEFKSSETVFTDDMIVSSREVQDVINNLSLVNLLVWTEFLLSSLQDINCQY